jgi:hypothetical protein
MVAIDLSIKMHMAVEEQHGMVGGSGNPSQAAFVGVSLEITDGMAPIADSKVEADHGRVLLEEEFSQSSCGIKISLAVKVDTGMS